MLPRILAALLLLAGPALAQSTGPLGSGTQGAGGTNASTPDAVPGTDGPETVPGILGNNGGRSDGGPANPGSAAAPGTTPSGGGTGPLVPGRNVTTGGSAATR